MILDFRLTILDWVAQVRACASNAFHAKDAKTNSLRTQNHNLCDTACLRDLVANAFNDFRLTIDDCRFVGSPVTIASLTYETLQVILC